MRKGNADAPSLEQWPDVYTMLLRLILKHLQLSTLSKYQYRSVCCYCGLFEIDPIPFCEKHASQWPSTCLVEVVEVVEVPERIWLASCSLEACFHQISSASKIFSFFGPSSHLQVRTPLSHTSVGCSSPSFSSRPPQKQNGLVAGP